VYILLLDGLSNTELKARLESDRESIPNLSRIIDRGLMFNYGTIVNFPSITWPSHNALGTGAWCGHHDIVNPTYYLRETRETVTPQGTIWETGRFMTDEVETIFEAVHRVFGEWDGTRGEVTASINEPCMRGAGHSTLERRMLIDADKVGEMTRANREDTNPRWLADGAADARRSSHTDIHAMSQALMLFSDPVMPPPKFAYHEFSLTDTVGHDYGPHDPALLDALVETDKRIGKILRVMDERGLFDSTLFVITTDHGMAPVDSDLAADQTLAVRDTGLSSVLTYPLVYLLDMRVAVEPAADGRTVNVTVLRNDADTRGVYEPLSGARVRVEDSAGAVVAKGVTDHFGVCGLPLPVDKDPAELVVAVEKDGFNSRRLGLNGQSLSIDFRRQLYGDL
jgi:predicted AlkP superfamily pyrophosphatase or phosphodiesterase